MKARAARSAPPSGEPARTRLDDLFRRSEEARELAGRARARSRELRQTRLGRLNRTGARLSMKELDVLSMLAAGLPTKAIALQMGISGHTVNYHLANIYRKLQVHNRVDASTAYLRTVRNLTIPATNAEQGS